MRPLLAFAVVLPLLAVSASADDREIPAPLAPLEYLVGSWKGQGVNQEDPSQRVRGWTETHAWAWIFADGHPVGMSVALENSRTLKAGKLVYDAAREVYVLTAEPTEGDGQAVYEGTLDKTGKLLTLDREGVPAGMPAERITIRANANYVRYTLNAERRTSRAGSFRKVLETGLTKEGETFAAGSNQTEKPRCVVTGGAAAMSLTYQGKTYPICCSGCRDEFLESPEKYLKKLAARPTDSPRDEKQPSPPKRSSGDDDDF
jgi:YHS domain-containing protein